MKKQNWRQECQLKKLSQSNKNMKTKRISQLEQIELGKTFEICLESRAWRLLGCFWTKEIKTYFDKTNGDFVLEYI